MSADSEKPNIIAPLGRRPLGLHWRLLPPPPPQAVGQGAPQAINACMYVSMYVCVSRWSLWGAERGWADVGLWVAVCFLAKIFHIGLHVKPRLHAWHSHRQSRSHFAFSSLSHQGEIRLFFIFRISFFIQNYRFLYHGDQKISWWTSMQVAGCLLRNPPVKFRQERWLHIWRSISIRHVQMEAGLNSDPGNDSFWDKIRDAKHVDRSTQYNVM